MKQTIMACAIAVAMTGLYAYQHSAAPAERELMTIERTSLDGWLKGDSGPMLAAADSEITLFHVMTNGRLDGIEAVKALYAPYAGRPLYDRYEIENPKVQGSGETAVLSYQLVTHNGDTTRNWNATEVYRKGAAGWRVIHSHFSAIAQ